MRSGTMRDFVTLTHSTPTTDARFGTTPGWTNYAQVWCNVKPVDGTEEFMQQGVQTSVTHTIQMRYRADVTNTDRIIYRGQNLDIVSAIDPDGRRRELLIQAKLNKGTT
jgi:SPP1 family predicted phage head-tail adaptor